jgi:hypothetical protein
MEEKGGSSLGGSMKKLIQARVPALFVHDLVNKLAVIVGHCDFVSDHLKEGSQRAKRVSAVQGEPERWPRN